MCTVTCPKGLNPQAAINELVGMVAKRKEKAQEYVLWFEIIKLSKINTELYLN